MLLLQADSISFSYFQRDLPLLRQLSFQLGPQSRIGLIGANGSGKSTLLQILLGRLRPDTGRLLQRSGLKIAYLAQEPLRQQAATSLRSFLWQAQPELAQLWQQIQNPATPAQACLEALDSYEQLGGYEFEARLDQWLERFALRPEMLDQPLERLSGGQRTRLGLLQLCLQTPDLLLLDEPTNHLDQAMLDWLEDFLVTSATPWLLVSHDRHLLEGAVETIWELQDGQLKIERGNYSSFESHKAQEQARRQLLYEQQSKKARQLQVVAAERRQTGQAMENFKPSRSVRKNGGICARDEGSGQAQVRTRNVMRSAKAAEYRAERVRQQAIELRPQRQREPRLNFRAQALRCRFVLQLKNISCSRAGQTLFQGLDLALSPGQKLVVQGPNGCGKSSLLQLLMAELQPDSGTLEWAEGVRLGYFAQDSYHLEPQLTVLQALRPEDPQHLTLARTLLACLGIGSAQISQKIESLSAGERTKVALAALVASEPEVLILDEPTNHLELSARKGLEEALQAYPGTLILVSHDRWLAEAVGSQFLQLGPSTRLRAQERAAPRGD